MEKRKFKIIVAMVITIFMITTYHVINSIKCKTDISYSEIMADEKESQSVNNMIEDLQEENANHFIKVYITGEVNQPGVIQIEYGSRIVDAIEKAGGTTNMADLSNVNLAYCLEDGQKINIPNLEEDTKEYISIENGEDVVEMKNSSDSSLKVNINRATEAELQKIPGVGPAMAQKIIVYRKENGKFRTIEDLKKVNGIGEKKFEKMKTYIEVK